MILVWIVAQKLIQLLHLYRIKCMKSWRVTSWYEIHIKSQNTWSAVKNHLKRIYAHWHHTTLLPFLINQISGGVTRIFSIAYTKAWHWTWSWTSSLHFLQIYHPTSPTSILILCLIQVSLCSLWMLARRSAHKYPAWISCLPHPSCHISELS